MRNLQFGSFTLILSMFISLANGQYIVSYESLGTKSKTELETQLGRPMRTGVSLVKILYNTIDVHGQPDTASGLLVYPDQSLNDVQPIVVYQHGTTNGPNDVPSKLQAGSTEALAYGGMGYVAVAADYLGLGDNPGIHPYVHAASEASAGLDLLFAVAEWIEVTTGEGWIGDLFVSGYSQGGHAAAALQKEIEDYWSLVFPVTAATLMSGPYSISGVMFDRIIGDEEYYTPAYIAYVALSYQEAYGNLYNELGDLFKPAYVPIIENFRDHEITTTTLNILLSVQIFTEAGVSRPKVMFKDSVLQEIINNEDHPFRVALRDNDLYDWTPNAPTRLYYCTADEQVPYQNAIVADSVMNMNGAPDVAAVNFGALNHGGCATPAITASIAFFDSFILGSAVRDVSGYQEASLVYPNPAFEILTIAPEYEGQLSGIRLTDIAGRDLLSIDFPQNNTLNISGLGTGMYILTAHAGDTVLQQRVIVNK